MAIERTRFHLGLIGLCMLAMPAQALPQSVSRATFLVINNSAAPLLCATRQAEGGWSAYFPIAPGGEWTQLTRRSGDRILFFCAAPAKRQVFTIAAGQRYSLLKSPDGEGITLTRIDIRE